MCLRLVLVLALTCVSGACLKAPPFQGVTGDGGSGDGDGGNGLSLEQWAYLKAGDPGAGDRFGTSVAISASGSTLAVGAPDEDGSTNVINGAVDDSAADAGAVNVFSAALTGEWVHQAYIKANNSLTDDSFGASVALSADGDTLVVGASGQADAPSSPDAGAVYVFIRNGAAWTQQAELHPTVREGGDKFGASVALSSNGNTLVVGAKGEDSSSADPANNSAPDAGAAYVFTRSITSWTESAYLKAPNVQSSDRFGVAVAISGDASTIVVGAIGEDSGTKGIDTTPDELKLSSGAVYVYRFNSGWTAEAYIKPSNTDLNWEFGTSVALSADGNVLVAGGPGDLSNGAGVNGAESGSRTRSGAAFGFTRTGTTWSQTVYLKATNPDINDMFGISVALSRDATQILVGAWGESSAATGLGGDPQNNSAASSGAAYLFEKATQWQHTAFIKASNAEAGDQFGTSVALADVGSTFAIGATREDSANTVPTDNSAQAAGAVYVFRRPE